VECQQCLSTFSEVLVLERIFFSIRDFKKIFKELQSWSELLAPLVNMIKEGQAFDLSLKKTSL